MTALSSAQRSRAEQVCDQIADALTLPKPIDSDADYGPRSSRWLGQSLSKGAAGVAVLHGIRAQHGLGHPERVHPWLVAATREDLSAAPGSGLWFGAPAVAYAIHTAAPYQYTDALSRLDKSISIMTADRLAAAEQRSASGVRPVQGEFDLVRGLTGIGAYLLHRDPDGLLIRRLLRYLVGLTVPFAADDALGTAAPGWWTYDQPADADPAYAAGHANAGMAHGIAGPLALMSLAIRRGIVVDGQPEAIDAISRWLEQWRHESPTGPWWPERITLDELRTGRSSQSGSARPSWCYGTPGIARALQLAAIALDDRNRQRAAEHAMARCLQDPAQLATIIDPALCHGWAGVVAAASSIAADALNDQITDLLPALADHLLWHAHDITPDSQPGLIDGSAGIALALHHLANGTITSWQTPLLLS